MGSPRGGATVALAAAALLGACGDDREVADPAEIERRVGGKTAPERTPSRRGRRTEARAPAPEKPPEPARPRGVLSTTGIGPVVVGMESERVQGLFGTPPRKQQVNFGQGPAPQIDWIWAFPAGELRLQFETERGTLTGYVVSTPSFATSSGARVGSSFAPIRQRFGDQLEKDPIGSGSWILSQGKPGSFPALVFTVEKETITHISGGERQPAGE
jgi:hypothetical protein